jgi:hypothetical protein
MKKLTRDEPTGLRCTALIEFLRAGLEVVGLTHFSDDSASGGHPGRCALRRVITEPAAFVLLPTVFEHGLLDATGRPTKRSITYRGDDRRDRGSRLFGALRRFLNTRCTFLRAGL